MPPTNKSPRHLDPRRPLVLDTRELGRRPGSIRRVHTCVPAPERLSLELIGVAPGASVELDLRLESVMEGVLVSGTATSALTGECGRCLDPVTSTISVDLQELYAYPDSATGETTADDEVSRLDGDFLDLEPVLRDAVVLGLPLTPLCRRDCAGLCAGCGGRLDELPRGHTHEQTDPRWADLASLLHPSSTTVTHRQES
ncbi:MAG: YceD family protein [Mycobacteriales bacterium]